MVCGIKGCRNSRFKGVCDVIDEQLISLKKPKNNRNRFTTEQWQHLHESIQYRCIRYRLTGRKEVLTIVTTLVEAKRFSAAEIAELYGLRWDVELDITCWKTTRRSRGLFETDRAAKNLASSIAEINPSIPC